MDTDIVILGAASAGRAAARPGKAHARDVLREVLRQVLARPVGDGIRFAGQALAGGLNPSAGGARISGAALGCRGGPTAHAAG